MNSIKQLIKIMEYKRDNIKAHIPPAVFQEVVDRLKELESVNTKLYAEMRENYDLKQRLGRK